jgi:hypothetical protein
MHDSLIRRTTCAVTRSGTGWASTARNRPATCLTIAPGMFVDAIPGDNTRAAPRPAATEREDE